MSHFRPPPPHQSTSRIAMAAAAPDVVTKMDVVRAILLLVQDRGCNIVEYREGEIDPTTKATLNLAKSSGGRWWTTLIPLNPAVALEIPHKLTARKHGTFYWSWDDEKENLRVFVKDPPEMSKRDLAFEMERRLNLMHEVKMPMIMNQVKAVRQRMDILQKRYELAPELVPHENGSVSVEVIAERPKLREKAEKEAARVREKMLHDNLEVAEQQVLKPVFEFLGRIEVRVKILEEKDEKVDKVIANQKHLQEQMTKIFEFLKIPVDAPKPAPIVKQGPAPVNKKEEESIKKEDTVMTSSSAEMTKNAV